MNKITDLDFDNWLIGFIQAEGCFSIRTNGIKSFSIGQNFGWNIINKIKQKFNIPNIIRVGNLKQNYTNCPEGIYQIYVLFVSIETKYVYFKLLILFKKVKKYYKLKNFLSILVSWYKSYYMQKNRLISLRDGNLQETFLDPQRLYVRHCSPWLGGHKDQV